MQVVDCIFSNNYAILPQNNNFIYKLINLLYFNYYVCLINEKIKAEFRGS